MSVGIGTQFTASLGPGQTQTWFTHGWDPNYFVIWSIRPNNPPAQVRLDRLQIASDDKGITYWLTITNAGQSPASFEAKYYFKTIIPEKDWRCLGPDHLSGCVVQVAIDPNNSDRIYALAQGGGLWRLDSVASYPSSTWVPLSDQHSSLVGFALAIAPSDSSTLYLAEGSNLLRSTDAGTTWALASKTSLWSGSDPWSHAARRIIIDPQNVNRIFVASNTGFWQTTDGGNSWKQLVAEDITDAAMDPGNSSVLYIAKRNVGVLKSLNGGSTWTTVLQTPPDKMVKIALGKQGDFSHRTVVVKFDQNVFVNKSAGSGSWNSSTLPSDPTGEKQFEWNSAVDIDPFNDNVILAGSQELYRSIDQGVTWSTVVSYYHPHEDQQSVVFDPRNQGVVYLSNDGGVFRSPDGGQTWTSGSTWSWNDVFGTKYDLNYGLVTTLFYRFGISANDIVGPVAVGPAHHQGLLASRFVKSTEWEGIQGHAWEMAQSYCFPHQPGTFYLFQGSSLFRQLYPQTGTSNDLVGIFPNVSPTAIGMNNAPNSVLLLVGTSSGHIFSTLNPNGNPPTWTQIPNINSGKPIVSIAFAPSSAGTAYAISESGAVFRNNNVESPNNWVNMGSNWSSGGVVQIAVSPTNSSTLYLISKNLIARSTDEGKTWVPFPRADALTLGTSSFQSIVANPLNDHMLFVSGNPGVFVSTDAGNTWSKFDDGLPNASASWLQWHGEFLYVSTWGRGLWRRQPFAQYGDDNMNIVTQFTGTLTPGQSHTWLTWGWPQNWFVVWSVHPTSDQGEVSLEALDVELEPTGITYHLTITNTGSQPAAFEAKYGSISF